MTAQVDDELVQQRQAQSLLLDRIRRGGKVTSDDGEIAGETGKKFPRRPEGIFVSLL